MEKLVYVWYPIIALLLLWGAKFYGKGKWNEEFMTLSQTKMIQGFLAICILFHHAAQKTCASWLHPLFVVHGLDFFVEIGHFFVAVFLFCSGYGLYKSVRSKENYLQGFVKKRVLPIIVAFYVTAIIFTIVRALMGQKMDLPQVLRYLSGVQLSNPNAWYVVAIPIFYLGFYLSFRFIKKEGWAIAGTGFAVFLYVLLGTFTNHNDYLMCGEWWYNTAHMFMVGILFAKFEKGIIERVKKHYIIHLVVGLVAVPLLYRWSGHMLGIFSYYGETWGAPDTVFRRWMSLLSQVISTTSFVWAVLLLNLKCKLGNPALKFMGTITLEFYLIHGVFIELFGYSFQDLVPSLHYIRNVALYVLVLIACTVPSAYLLHKFLNVLCYGKKKKGES